MLVDHNTAGTAEWLAAALQDNHRAVVVGSPTRGAHRARPFGGLPMEDDGAGPFEYEATGVDSPRRGRPLVDRAGDRPPRARRRPSPGRCRPAAMLGDSPRASRSPGAESSPIMRSRTQARIRRHSAVRSRLRACRTRKASHRTEPAGKPDSSDRPRVLECRREGPPRGPEERDENPATSSRRIGAFCLAALLLASPAEIGRGRARPGDSPARRLRQPVALAFVDGGKTLLAANRRSGSLSVIDAASRQGRGRARRRPRPGRPRRPARRPPPAGRRSGSE